LRILAPILCLALLASCGGTGTSKGQTGQLSGNWQMTLLNPSYTETQSGFLLQSGNTVTGNLLLSGQTLSGQLTCSGVGPAVGQLSGSNLSITLTPAGQTVNLTGSPSNNFTSMSGDYSILAAGCGQTETGTWTGTRVNNLTGNLQASFTLDGSTQVFHFSGNLTQGTNTGSSTANISGTMTSTDSPCFTSASLAGAVSGTSVVLNLLTSDGEALGKYSGTMTTDATSITGTYRFSNASDPNLLGICEGYGGAATVAIQSSGTS